MITITSTPNPAIPTATPLVANGTPSSSAATSSFGSLSFGDIVDALNPLQHIPIVSGALRAASGSTISPVSEIAGDALYGTLTGSAAVSIASSVGDVAVTQMTGKSIGQNVLSAINSLTSPSSSTAASTPLVADSPIVSQAIAASQANAQSSSSANTMLANANSPSAFFKAMQEGTSSGAAQYQRAQILDNANKMLVKMAV
jgi:hypothetical protein